MKTFPASVTRFEALKMPDVLESSRQDDFQPVLEMKNISKSFSGVSALRNVDFQLYPGEIHALMGENGAGKSTLMKILSGLYQPTGGEILLKGKRKSFSGPLPAQEAGIAIIHQEFNLFPNLSAAENIFFDRRQFAISGRINWKRLNAAAKALINSIGADFDVTREVEQLSVHSRQVIEIAKAISMDADILIMDEPSAALPESEVQNMFRVVRGLKKRGVAIVYVSHRMHEIFQIADRVTVLRDGERVDTKRIPDTSDIDLIHMMIGREVRSLYGDEIKPPMAEVVMRVRDLELTPDKRVSFELHKGEVLGLFGLLGSGSHTLVSRLFGLKSGKGTIEISGQTVAIRSPRDAMESGIGLVPADRHRQGLVRQMSVIQNICMTLMGKLATWGVIHQSSEREVGAKYHALLNIRTPSLDQPTELLSGGNQQKVVLAKWLATNPKVLILEEATRGVDVGAKQEIYRIIREIAEQGFSILLISTEMPEVLGMSDRILVLREGEFVAAFGRGGATQAQLLSVASRIRATEPVS
jgi:inositol transport system ATP-binding protein